MIKVIKEVSEIICIPSIKTINFWIIFQLDCFDHNLNLLEHPGRCDCYYFFIPFIWHSPTDDGKGYISITCEKCHRIIWDHLNGSRP